MKYVVNWILLRIRVRWRNTQPHLNRIWYVPELTLEFVGMGLRFWCVFIGRVKHEKIRTKPGCKQVNVSNNRKLNSAELTKNLFCQGGKQRLPFFPCIRTCWYNYYAIDYILKWRRQIFIKRSKQWQLRMLYSTSKIMIKSQILFSWVGTNVLTIFLRPSDRPRMFLNLKHSVFFPKWLEKPETIT